MKKSSQLAFRIAFIYVIVSGAWILFSDVLVKTIISNPDTHIYFSIIKGWGFVVVTGILLYLVLRRLLRHSEQEVEQRKQVEAALLKSKQHYQDLFEHMNEGFAYCQMIFEDGQPKDFVYLAVNQKFSALTGLKQVIGKRATEIIPGVRESDPEFFAIYGRVAATGKSERLERFVVSLNQWFDLSVYGMEPNHFVVVFDVITERKRAEAELRQTIAFLEAQTNSTQDGILVVDTQGKKILQNRRLNEMWKYPPQIVEDKDDAAQLQFATNQTKNSGEFAKKVAYLYAHPDEIGRDEIELLDGTIFDRYSAPVRDPAGKYYGRIWTFRDITANKRTEAQVHLQLSALTAAANAIIITNRKGNIEWINPAFTKLTGYNADEVIGANPRMLKSDEHPPEFYTSMWQTILAGKVWHSEVVNRRKDGTLYTEEMTITPVRGADGQIAHFVAIKQDVTERRLLETELRQAQKMEAIGQLASGVAHDFNNILGVIQLQAGLLKAEQNLSPGQLEFADEIEKAAERAADLTRQLLLFSRKQALQLCDLDLNEVVTNIAKMLQRILGEDVQMKVALAPQPLLIHADTGMMNQILLNLTVNARDAMAKSGRLVIETSAVEFDEVTAAQTASARPGAFVCVSVTDTGSGIPLEILPHIFEPFFTTKEAGKGTGLGLATVFGIIEQLHGWINVQSETGRGTTFKIFLPRLAGTLDKKAAWMSLATIAGGKETILLAEDDRSLRDSIRTALTRLGYRVLEAATGSAAVEMWNQHRGEIQLLLTDMLMPDGMSGQELARRLRQENPRLKVIYASGHLGEIGGQDLVLEAGVNFLTKPFEAHKLAQTVRNCLDKN